MTRIDWAFPLVSAADRVAPPSVETQTAVYLMIGEPLPDAGENRTSSAPEGFVVGVAVTFAGACGVPILIAGEAGEVGPTPSALICGVRTVLGPVPSLFIAATLKVYCRPLDKPVITSCFALEWNVRDANAVCPR